MVFWVREEIATVRRKVHLRVGIQILFLMLYKLCPWMTVSENLAYARGAPGFDSCIIMGVLDG